MNLDEIIEKITPLIADAIEHEELVIGHEDNYYLTITIVSNTFDGLRPVKRQQMVYQPINEFIADGSIHAVKIKAMTPKEWRLHKKLNF
ncbi:BolA/IbaG family iron-sulfur metabolism protein [Catenovulum sp. 2E275]|uniref:BolA family protein n=1 Tax=Catenovulum sp. 2E275 TaxID=2980497 RepID=UPI0021CFAF32|nr:BolA/IbaG family iron-sulfur metabolism protein [Catenovulum sp. 2E275]MCU4675472.1 BolA/IbaG family iron-sulfur metabolism protein [Catenovulum sp. 2E275]